MTDEEIEWAIVTKLNEADELFRRLHPDGQPFGNGCNADFHAAIRHAKYVIAMRKMLRHSSPSSWGYWS